MPNGVARAKICVQGTVHLPEPIMSSSHERIAMFATWSCSLSRSAWAGTDADSAFLQGQKLLADGDLRAAVKAYGTAVKLDRDNQQYLQQYMLARRAVVLQDALAKEPDPQKWEETALALRSFFNAQGLHAQTLPLDRAMLERSETADNAMQLAETLLALEQTDEAAAVLTGLDPQQATTASQAMLAVALPPRQGQAGTGQGDCQEREDPTQGRSGHAVHDRSHARGRGQRRSGAVCPHPMLRSGTSQPTRFAQEPRSAMPGLCQPCLAGVVCDRAENRVEGAGIEM